MDVLGRSLGEEFTVLKRGLDDGNAINDGVGVQHDGQQI